MNLLQKLACSINTIYTKIMTDNDIEQMPIYYIGGSQTLPPPLSPEEEEELVNKLETGGLEVRQKLVERNLRLVVYIAKKFENTGVGLEDLISIGTIGLMKGVNTFNADKKIKLATYASRCIENEILMYFRSNKKNNNTVSLNDSIGYDKDGNEINLIDVIKDNSKDIAEELHTKNNIALLTKYLNLLNPREKQIIVKRYGLGANDEKTQKEIAKEMNISRSYVSRIEKRAITKILREFLKSKNDF